MPRTTDTRNRSWQNRKVEITNSRYGSVGFDLIDSDHNLSRHIGRDSNAHSFPRWCRSRRGFEAGALTAPPIDTVPFESKVEVYARVAEGRV
jgi:hypothetical protein